MAKLESPESGIQRPYDARYGITVGKCRGLNLSHDPSMIADEELTQAVNIRIHDGIGLSRPGQETLVDTSSGCVQGMIDINGGGPRFAISENDSAAAQPFYSYVYLFDRATWGGDMTVEPPRLTDLDGVPVQGQDGSSFARSEANPRYLFFWWNGRIVFSGRKRLEDGNVVADPAYLWELIIPDEDPEGGAQSRQVFKLEVPGEGVEFVPNNMAVLPNVGVQDNGGPLYFGTMGGGVVAWVNGELRRLLAEGTFSSRVFVLIFNNRLYAVGGDEIRVQDGWVTGASPVSTTWTSLTVPGTAAGLIPMCVVEWAGYGWVGGQVAGNACILRIAENGTVTDMPNAPSGGRRSVDDFAVALGSRLYAFTLTSVTAGAVYEWDGTDWTGPNIFGWGEAVAMCRLQGKAGALYAVGYGSDSATDNGLWAWDDVSEVQYISLPSDRGYTDVILF